MYNQINLDIYVVISREMLIWDDTDMLIYNMITQFNMKFKKKGGVMITPDCIMPGELLVAALHLEDISVFK